MKLAMKSLSMQRESTAGMSELRFSLVICQYKKKGEKLPDEHRVTVGEKPVSHLYRFAVGGHNAIMSREG